MISGLAMAYLCHTESLLRHVKRSDEVEPSYSGQFEQIIMHMAAGQSVSH